MQAPAAGRCAHSVSELYAADEVELLLEELRELERPAGRPEDIQDFEIAGSQTGGAWSPGGTERSWDSHPHYRRRRPPRPARVAPLYCRAAHLLSPPGAARLAVALASLAAAAALYAARPHALPHAARLRLLLATALFSLMASAALLFLDVSRLAHLFPFNWAKLNAWLYICIGTVYVIASSVAMAAIFGEDYSWVPRPTVDLLITSTSFGLIGGAISWATALVYCYRRPSMSSTSALLVPQSPTPSGTPQLSPSPSPPPSRRVPAYLPVPVEPDPLPCSSKTPL